MACGAMLELAGPGRHRATDGGLRAVRGAPVSIGTPQQGLHGRSRRGPGHVLCVERADQSLRRGLVGGAPRVREDDRRGDVPRYEGRHVSYVSPRSVGHRQTLGWLLVDLACAGGCSSVACTGHVGRTPSDRSAPQGRCRRLHSLARAASRRRESRHRLDWIRDPLAVERPHDRGSLASDHAADRAPQDQADERLSGQRPRPKRAASARHLRGQHEAVLSQDLELATGPPTGAGEVLGHASRSTDRDHWCRRPRVRRRRTSGPWWGGRHPDHRP